ncbi:rasGEF domain-containing protein [Ditylenchus destructor]|uniref:RasGEF domain-containing protein n=1 Tax=Ditylenchus destructor TaxID=166010 RepID=A0AAD4NBI5_9BILA|nr:rasGEF domain-containing protein [Ditylenchus destructor]
MSNNRNFMFSGSLPCPKEEAALMAAIQLCVEENWPSNKRTQTIRRHLLKGQFAQKIMVTPWEVDTQLYCTPAHRAYSESTSAFHTAHKVSLAAQQQQSSESRRRRSIAFFTPFFCMSEPDATMSLDVQNSCLPPDLRGDRRTIKLIKERKRKLFHSHIFESEASMKKLYVQTAKRLPAFGCKVFQVKELLHGRTLRKTVRLLCLSSSILCLLDAPSYNVLKSISMTLWEIMQSRASILIQKSFNKSARPSLAFDTQIHSAQSSRTNSYSSTASSFRNSLCCGEPITLFRLELERLQYILHFPEEVAFQLSATEYSLFYAISPIDFIRYVGSDLASIPIAENPSAVRNLVKRLSEVSSWITHVIISQPTHEDRKNCLAAIIRVVDMCWKIGNFNAAVEILMGLKSNKLRPFWLSLKVEERRSYEEFVEILLPNNESAPHALYIEALQRALRMPQCRVIPFFGTFLRDLYAIVNDMPNVVIIGNDGEVEKLSFMQDLNGDDHYSSNIGVGGLLNTDKIGLVGIILDNLETFHKHNKQLMKYVEDSNGGTANPLEDSPEVKPYEPVQPIVGSAHGVTLIPLTTLTFDLDIIQKIQHGTTVIRYEPDTGRSEKI